jgi:hypothetical protein
LNLGKEGKNWIDKNFGCNFKKRQHKTYKKNCNASDFSVDSVCFIWTN